jgi:hypothetical protein
MRRTLTLVLLLCSSNDAKVADRSRLVKHRAATGQIDGYHDNGYPIEGHSYRRSRRQVLFQQVEEEVQQRLQMDAQQKPMLHHQLRKNEKGSERPILNRIDDEKGSKGEEEYIPKNFFNDVIAEVEHPKNQRELSSQLSGCCYNYKSYTAANLCALYGNDCESGSTKSHDDGDGDCSGDGLSFIGISFSVNTASGNPYSYQLCDQFPMENIIDRDYEYVMSMDEDGWLVGGGYKTFDYSGKMPYVSNFWCYCYDNSQLLFVQTCIAHTLNFTTTDILIPVIRNCCVLGIWIPVRAVLRLKRSTRPCRPFPLLPLVYIRNT